MSLFWIKRFFPAVSSTLMMRLCLVPPIIVLEVSKCVYKVFEDKLLSQSHASIPTHSVVESEFPGVDAFETVLEQMQVSGLRSTASPSHEKFMSFIEQKLGTLPGISLAHDPFDVLKWQTKDGKTLQESGSISIGGQLIEVAGAVPYSKPTTADGVNGPLVYVLAETKLSNIDINIRGKIILRELPRKAIPYSLGWIPSYSKTLDLNWDIAKMYERPSFWEIPQHHDLIEAEKRGAIAIIFIIDLPQAQICSYWDPHQGTHYLIPSVFVGADAGQKLKLHATKSMEATISIQAEVSSATTRNIIATLPGQIDETVIFATHTDGNTVVQDNGVAAMLALAEYFSRQPLSQRRRTLQFAFNTAHLHVSKEGSGRHAEQLDACYDDGKTTLVIPVEHLGTKELELRSRNQGQGKELYFTGRGEIMFWCVGPSLPLIKIVQRAITRRKLDRVLLTRGTSIPKRNRVPTFDSFGGLGTLYHNFLLPTTSIISGPWSLFAPSFGKAAVDVHRLRQQTLAVGDVYLGVENLTREEIAGGYLDYRKRRSEGAYAPGFVYPPETLG